MELFYKKDRHGILRSIYLDDKALVELAEHGVNLGGLVQSGIWETRPSMGISLSVTDKYVMALSLVHGMQLNKGYKLDTFMNIFDLYSDGLEKMNMFANDLIPKLISLGIVEKR